jgi:hypothetical protein
MIQIQGNCSTCRVELELEVADLLLLVPEDAAPSGAPRLVHGCSACGATSVRTLEWRMTNILKAHGVASLPDLELEPTAEPHPENPPAGPGLTADEAIDLHELLQTADWFDQLVASGRST